MLAQAGKTNEYNSKPRGFLAGFIGVFDTTAIMPLEAKGPIMSTLKALNSVSEMLVRASGQIDKRIAEHLVNIAKHINGAGNGDVSAANHFFSLLTSRTGVRKDAIGNWLMAYAGCSWNADKKQFGRKKDFSFDLQAAVENPWYVFTQQKEFQPFDLDKALKTLVARAKGKLAEEALEHKGHVVNKQRLRALELILAGDFQFEDELENDIEETPEALPNEEDTDTLDLSA